MWGGGGTEPKPKGSAGGSADYAAEMGGLEGRGREAAAARPAPDAVAPDASA